MVAPVLRPLLGAGVVAPHVAQPAALGGAGLDGDGEGTLRLPAQVDPDRAAAADPHALDALAVDIDGRALHAITAQDPALDVDREVAAARAAARAPRDHAGRRG